MLSYFLLALVGICSGQQFAVRIQYNDPRITLSVHEADRDVSSVEFHFGVRTTNRIERGTRTATGDWVYSGQLQTNNGDAIHAYAEIHFTSGLLIQTPQATQNVGGPAVPPGGRQVRAVIFRDDFNSYNKANWHPEISMFGGMNWEFEVYTPDARNIYSNGGHLVLKPNPTTDDPRFDDNFLHSGIMDVAQIWGSCTNDGNYGCHREGKNGLLPPVESGKVSSNPTLRFGTVEVRARLPRGDWLWPAIWMMPKDSKYGGWPRSGEIDIVESRGNAGANGVNGVSSTLHWGPAWDQNKYGLTHAEKQGPDYSADFHTYRLEWSEAHLQTFVDNALELNVDVGNGFWAKGGFSGANIWASGTKAAPFDQDFYLILNVAVGGTNGFFPDNINWGVKKPWANNSPHAADDFWAGKAEWLPTWKGENAALVVDYVEFRN